MEALRLAALLAATITTGLMAGLFYAYSISVMPALRHTGAATLVEVMQRINRAILNPWFVLAFAGALVTGLAAAVLTLLDGNPAVWTPAVAALLLYAAQLAITATVNIPLNNALDAAGPHTPDETRAAFETRWVRWNTARTWLTTASFAGWAWSLLAV
ncbi:anthrone oxygenase family protein [Symbioplanes lichenis]|uniref:anthrone oxygenase family protein n=1 Tax=Symbioplanes lichenis TaxID=1629072 RepID=UPI002739D039|nr:anthrone oxygenase family protein [Actinoplanes lichenis]